MNVTNTLPEFVQEVLEPAIMIIKEGEEYINSLFLKTEDKITMISIPLGDLRDQLFPALISFNACEAEEMVLLGEARMALSKDMDEFKAFLSVYKHGDMKKYEHIEVLQTHYIHMHTKTIKIYLMTIDRIKNPLRLGEMEEIKSSGFGAIEMIFKDFLDLI